MLEKDIERFFVDKIKEKKGLAIKLAGIGIVGLPDRIILLPNKKICFCEFKRIGQRPRPIQLKRKRQIEGLGFDVYIIDSLELAKDVINKLC